MFARLHDQGLGFVRRLAGNFCQFIHGKVGQFVAGVHTAVCQFADQFGSEAGEVCLLYTSPSPRD